MSISRLMLAITLCAMLSTSALAQQAPAQGSGGTGSMVTLDVTPFFTSVDTNKDNSVSSAEWKAAGLNESVFTIFDSDNKGAFPKDTMANMSHPSSMDADNDGKLTLDEFKNATNDIYTAQ